MGDILRGIVTSVTLMILQPKTWDKKTYLFLWWMRILWTWWTWVWTWVWSGHLHSFISTYFFNYVCSIYWENQSHSKSSRHYKIQHSKSLVTQVASPAPTPFTGFPAEYNVQINITALILKAQYEFGYSYMTNQHFPWEQDFPPTAIFFWKN